MRICLLLSIFLLASCRQNTRQKEMQEILLQWQGRELVVPRLPTVHWNQSDSCNLYSNEYTIAYYMDGDCHSCVDMLPKIDSVYQIIKTSNSMILVYVHSGDYSRFEKALSRRPPLKIPLIYDKENIFYRKNNLSTDPLFHCFLLDKNHKVVIAGSFIANQPMKELYVNVLKSMP